MEDLIRISVGGGALEHPFIQTQCSGGGALEHPFIQTQCREGGGGTRASFLSDTVEDLIRISVEGSSLEDVDARESVVSWFIRGQRSRDQGQTTGVCHPRGM